VETLRQNLHPFQAEENARNAAIDKAFSMTGSQNDPLEGVKILSKNASSVEIWIVGKTAHIVGSRQAIDAGSIGKVRT
jgi:hypothetical protein